ENNMSKTLRELFAKYPKNKSPFEATNKDLEYSRFHDDIEFKSEEERTYYFSLGDWIDEDEIKRLTIGMEKFGYDNAELINSLKSKKKEQAQTD
ncbi:MAG: hypothetical protein Q4D95_06005, partial [Peptoniphilus sp.]|nr:hypothetical protein [Peptoniphilus sp.]